MMLQVNDLTYHYGAQTVLDEVSFELAAGRVGLLVGQNGAGKSTLLRCIAGWAHLDAGTVQVNGIDVERQERAYRHQVIFVPNTPDFYDELTVGEHMQFIAQLHHLHDWEAQAADLLDRFRLSTSRDAFPFTLSRDRALLFAVIVGGVSFALLSLARLVLTLPIVVGPMAVGCAILTFFGASMWLFFYG